MAYMANQRDKINKFSGNDKATVQGNNEIMKKGPKTTTATSKSGVKGTASSSGSKNGPYKDLPKSVKISGSASGTTDKKATNFKNTQNMGKVARVDGGISGTAGKNVTPLYK